MDRKRLATAAAIATAFLVGTTGVLHAQIELDFAIQTGAPVSALENADDFFDLDETFLRFGAPVMGEGDLTAWTTDVDGPSVTPGTDTALIAGTPETLNVLAREGGPAPGGGSYVNFTEVNLNGDGVVMWLSEVLNGTQQEALFMHRRGVTTRVLGEGDPLPGVPGVTIGRGTFGSLGLFDPRLNGNWWAVSADLTGPGVTFENNEAHLVGPLGGAPGVVARKGDAAPVSGDATFQFIGPPVLSALGEIVFDAFLTGPGVTPANQRAAFVGKPGSLEELIRQGAAVPGFPGEQFDQIGTVSRNNAGDVAFRAGFAATSVFGLNAIFFGTAENLKPLVRRGGIDPATGLLFTELDPSPVVTGAGEVLFFAEVDSIEDVVFIARPGEIRRVAAEGEPAPGIPGAFFLESFETFVNDFGEVTIKGSVTGNGIDASNDEGLWAVGPGGSLELIAREGTIVNVPSNDPRAVTNAVKIIAGFGFTGGGLRSGGEDGRRSALSAGGQVAFRLSFTDGTEAVVVAPPEARPVTLMAERPVEGGRATLFAPTGFAKKPVVIAGPATASDKKEGVVRLNKINKDGTFEAEFDRWTKGQHGPERLSFLVMPKGRQKLDGTTWEAGTFKLKGNRNWVAKRFKKKFKGTPELFLTLQSSKDKAPASVRARNVTKTGFEAALQEAEKTLGSGHKKEVVGYVAVYSKKKQGSLLGGIGGTPYRLARPGVNHKPKTVLGEPLRLEEDKSADKETRHKKEKVSVMTLGPAFFAQQVSDKEADTATPRR